MQDLPRPRPLRRQDALFLDFDGTLTSLAPKPDDIVVAPYLPNLLSQVSDALAGALALISGRTISAVDGLTGGTVKAIAGIHGLERRGVDGAITACRVPSSSEIAAARETLTHFARARPGVLIEDKGLAFAVHYRLNPSAEEACKEAARAVVAASDGELTLIQGNCVVEVMLRGPNKGTAVEEFLAEPPFAQRQPIFVGDDLTDEPAFREVERRGGLAVIVGDRRPTLARHGLKSVAEVHAWISQLNQDWKTEPRYASHPA